MDYTKLWGHIFIFRNCRLGIPLPEVKSLKTCFTELPFPERHSPANFHASLKSIIFHLQVSHSFKLNYLTAQNSPMTCFLSAHRALAACERLFLWLLFNTLLSSVEFMSSIFSLVSICVLECHQHGIVNYLFKSFTNHCTSSICK